MYYYCVRLNPKSAYVRRALTDVDILHKLVLSFFPDNLVFSESSGARDALELLFYLHQDETSAIVQMQSKYKPLILIHALKPKHENEQKKFRYLKSKVLGYAECSNETWMKMINPNMPFRNDREDWIEEGTILKVQSTVMPMTNVKRKDGTRVRHYRNTENAKKWFIEKMHTCAEVAEEIYCIPDPNSYTKDGVYLEHRPCVISTWVKIKDREEFKKVLVQGIGKEKAYGRGMIRILDRYEDTAPRFAS